MDEPSSIQLKKLTPESLKEIINSEVAQFDAQEIYVNGEGWMQIVELEKCMKVF